MDYNNVNEDIYNKLINIIYSNIDIARLGIDKDSFLLLILKNKKLKLDDDKKSFLINEALNCKGTVKDTEINSYLNIVNDKNLYSTGINNVDIDYPHGKGEYDIRYYILFNDNFTKDEKKNLIYDFYADDKIYEKYLNAWRNSVLIKYGKQDDD